jgi:hypothetical protein
VFSCKGCPDSPSSLFGNDAGRRLSNIEVTSDSFDDPTQSSRNLQFTAGEQCFCDVNVVDDVRTPTLAEFEALFAINVAILELPVTLNTTTVSENTQAPTTQAPSTMPPTTPLTDVPTTPQPVTAKPVTVTPVAPSSVPEDCVGDIQTIRTSVLLNFEGDLNNLLDPVELEAIGDVFEVAYNRLAESSCEGGSFRVVVDGVVQSDDTLQGQRDLQRISQGPKPFLKVSKPLIAVIIWQCNACGKGSKLLTNDAGRRTSKLSEAFDNYYDEDAASSTRGLQQVGVLDDDACAPCGPLSPDDFIVAYNEVLQEFIESGVVFDGISSLVSANELEEVDCSDDVKVVETTLAIAILGDPSEASEAEIALLEDSVASTLNSLNIFNPDTCDPFFRSVASVEVDRDVFSISTPPERHLMLNFKFKVIPFKTLFKIKFKCQGCPDGDNLLQNDAGRRQLLDATALDFEHYRRLQDVATPTEILTEGCLCAVGADEFLPPTREEFDAAFNVTVTALIAAEAIDFIFQVGVTQELDEISCAAGVDSRESQLEIDGLGDPNDLTPGNLTAIEEAIRASLDTLYAQSCDPEVRVILDVEIAGLLLARRKTITRRQMGPDVFN